MTEPREGTFPNEAPNKATIVWGASAALCIGAYLLSLNWLVSLIALITLLVLIPASIVYGIVTLTLTRKSKVEKWNLQAGERERWANPAARFAAVPQVMTLLATAFLVLAVIGTVIASLVAGALADPNSVYDSSEAYVFYAPLVTLSFIAVGFGAPYHFSRSIRAGEAAALSQNLSSALRIRRARAFNRVMLWIFTIASILLLVGIVISQIVTYFAVVNYGG